MLYEKSYVDRSLVGSINNSLLDDSTSTQDGCSNLQENFLDKSTIYLEH